MDCSRSCPTPCGWVLRGPQGRGQGARFGATYSLGLRLGLERAEISHRLAHELYDLGVPLIGVGLAYRQGYFKQQLTEDGWQLESYPVHDPHRLQHPALVGLGDDLPQRLPGQMVEEKHLVDAVHELRREEPLHRLHHRRGAFAVDLQSFLQDGIQVPGGFLQLRCTGQSFGTLQGFT